MTEASDKQIDALRPRDAKSLAEYRRVVGTALRVMIGDTLPKAKAIHHMFANHHPGAEYHTNYGIIRSYIDRNDGSGERIPAEFVLPNEFNGTVVVWLHPRGRSSLSGESGLTRTAQWVIDHKAAILAIDAFGTGELALAKPLSVNTKYAGYTFGYNRPLLAQRVHDVLTAIAFAKGREGTKTVHLVGWEGAGPWVLLARGLCGDAVTRTAADGDGFRFEDVRGTSDERILPGALKYGGLGAFAGLSAPGELFEHNASSDAWLKAAYDASGAGGKLTLSSEKQSAEKVLAWLLR
jgi:hypothetical protein